MWQIAARAVSNIGKVPKESCGVPPLTVLLQVTTKRTNWLNQKNREKCIRGHNVAKLVVVEVGIRRIHNSTTRKVTLSLQENEGKRSPE